MSRSAYGEPTRPGATAGELTSPYRERLTPAPWIWLAAAVLAGLSGLTTVPFGRPVPLVVGAIVAVLLVVALVAWSPVVTIADGELVAGRAHIPVRLLDAAIPLDAGTMRHALGPGLDARAYLCMRGWIATGVRVGLVDPDDPTPYWLISSRQPEALVAALELARAGAARAS